MLVVTKVFSFEPLVLREHAPLDSWVDGAARSSQEAAVSLENTVKNPRRIEAQIEDQQASFKGQVVIEEMHIRPSSRRELERTRLPSEHVGDEGQLDRCRVSSSRIGACEGRM